jgi:putative DNA primase/helicase
MQKEYASEPLEGDCTMVLVQKLLRGEAQMTDSTNAERLFKDNKDTIRYNVKWSKWLIWNGKYWAIDEGDTSIHVLGLKSIRNINRDAIFTDSLQEKLDIEKFAVQSESMHHRNACVEAATKLDEVRISNDELDKDDFLFNVENGTINLETGEFREHLSNE